jgi:hypothetical protein
VVESYSAGGLPFRFERVGHLVLFVPFWRSPAQARPQPIQITDCISHLKNSNGCGNLQVKVLLTVSPFRPFLPPQPRVYSGSRRLLPSYAPCGGNIPPVLSTLRILPVATGMYPDPFRSSRHALTSVPLSEIPYSQQFAASLSLFALFFAPPSFVFNSLQPLFAKHRGWGIPGSSRRSDAPFASRMYLRDLQTRQAPGVGWLSPLLVTRHLLPCFRRDTHPTPKPRWGRGAAKAQWERNARPA